MTSKVVMSLEVARINDRLRDLYEWHRQLSVKIEGLERRKAELLQDMEDEP